KLYPGRDGLSAASVYHSGGEVFVIAAEQDIESFKVALGSEDTDIEVGPKKATIRMPYPFFVTEVRAELSEGHSGGTVIFDINKDVGGVATSILSTRITINSGDRTS